MGSLLIALLLSGSPFPAPHRTVVTEATRCAWGPVVNSPTGGDKPTLVIQSPVGLVTFQVALDTPVFTPEGQQSGTVAGLRAGQKVRVYYVVDNGAKASEVDLET